MLPWEKWHEYLDEAVPRWAAVSSLGKSFKVLPGPTVLLAVKQEWAPMQGGQATESFLLGTDRGCVCV